MAMISLLAMKATFLATKASLARSLRCLPIKAWERKRSRG
jgi:hypothetical protein